MNNLEKGVGYIDKKLQLCIVTERGPYSIRSSNIYTNRKYAFAENGPYVRDDILSDGNLYTVPKECKNK